jgi:sec-independent protein translocase protein TatA/sec-independent protein translocase protein TatB
VSFSTILLIVIIVFLVFGPEKVPEVGRALGRATREFRKAMAELERSVDEQTAPVKKAMTEARDSANANVAEISKAVSIEQPKLEKPSEELRKPS